MFLISQIGGYLRLSQDPGHSRAIKYVKQLWGIRRLVIVCPFVGAGMAYNYGKLTKDVIAEIFPPAADPPFRNQSLLLAQFERLDLEISWNVVLCWGRLGDHFVRSEGVCGWRVSTPPARAEVQQRPDNVVSYHCILSAIRPVRRPQKSAVMLLCPISWLPLLTDPSHSAGKEWCDGRHVFCAPVGPTHPAFSPFLPGDDERHPIQKCRSACSA